MPSLDRAHVAACLAARPGRDVAVDGVASAGEVRRAAVAALLRWDAGEPEVLLMRRAEHERDRWSGQVSLPGGREEPGDRDLIVTAVRESREELGVDLERGATLLGRLDSIQAVGRGALLPLVVTPFVFAQDVPPRVVANYEVASWFWLPLGRAARGELDGTFTWTEVTTQRLLPAWDYDGHTVWGLTLRMLRQLLEILSGPP